MCFSSYWCLKCVELLESKKSSFSIFEKDDDDDDDDDDELFLCIVDWWKAFSHISSQDHYQRSSPSVISETPQAVFKTALNLSSGFVQWSHDQKYLHFRLRSLFCREQDYICSAWLVGFQTFRRVPEEGCFENMQQIYRRTPISKCCIFSEHLFLRPPLDGCFWISLY